MEADLLVVWSVGFVGWDWSELIGRSASQIAQRPPSTLSSHLLVLVEERRRQPQQPAAAGVPPLPTAALPLRQPRHEHEEGLRGVQRVGEVEVYPLELHVCVCVFVCVFVYREINKRPRRLPPSVGCPSFLRFFRWRLNGPLPPAHSGFKHTGEERVRREQPQVGPERRAGDGERGLEPVPWVGLLFGCGWGGGFGGGKMMERGSIIVTPCARMHTYVGVGEFGQPPQGPHALRVGPVFVVVWV